MTILTILSVLAAVVAFGYAIRQKRDADVWYESYVRSTNTLREVARRARDGELTV